METEELARYTLPELLERKKRLQYAIKLVEAEIKKKTPIEEKKVEKKLELPKKSAKNGITKYDIKMVLRQHGKTYKTDMKKVELMELARKHNLVRAVEEYSKTKKK